MFQLITALMTLPAVFAAPEPDAVPSVDVIIYKDLSTTDALCSSGRTVINVQNATCLPELPGYNSYQILATHNLPDNQICAVFALDSCTRGAPIYGAEGINRNGTFDPSCHRARNTTNVAKGMEFFCFR